MYKVYKNGGLVPSFFLITKMNIFRKIRVNKLSERLCQQQQQETKPKAGNF